MWISTVDGYRLFKEVSSVKNRTANIKVLKVKLRIQIGSYSSGISVPYRSCESPELWDNEMK